MCLKCCGYTLHTHSCQQRKLEYQFKDITWTSSVLQLCNALHHIHTCLNHTHHSFTHSHAHLLSKCTWPQMLCCTSRTWTEEITDQSKQACSFRCPPHCRNQPFQILLHPQKAHAHHKLEEITDSVETSLQLLLSSTQKKPAFSKPASSTKGPPFSNRQQRSKWKL